MTKLSQCARCKKDRRNCGYYKEEDDTDCPQYMPARQDEAVVWQIPFKVLHHGVVVVHFRTSFHQTLDRDAEKSVMRSPPGVLRPRRQKPAGRPFPGAGWHLGGPFTTFFAICQVSLCLDIGDYA